MAMTEVPEVAIAAVVRVQLAIRSAAVAGKGARLAPALEGDLRGATPLDGR
jgi:hypothetical protein